MPLRQVHRSAFCGLQGIPAESEGISVNDHDAMTAINAVLDQWLKGEIRELRALSRIAKICGENTIEHEAAK